jgi:pimeloyl-ACP methyl ester carboxylesterase
MVKAVEPDSITNHLAEIKAPVTLLLPTGPHDSGINSHKVQAMRERIPHFAVDSVPNCGLHVHEERPDVVVAEVLKLLGDGRRETGEGNAKM